MKKKIVCTKSEMVPNNPMCSFWFVESEITPGPMQTPNPLILYAEAGRWTIGKEYTVVIEVVE